MRPEYNVRKANISDLDTLVAFTVAEARDAEGADKDVDAIERGVRMALEDPSLASYWLAEAPGGGVVGSTSVVTEWSNFHGGHYWWVQSLYIVPEQRGRGLARLLLGMLAEEARAAGAVDLRLYAHNSNRRALEAYRRCGFETAPYTIMTRRSGRGQER
jgi:ribosomal protein S18 acetylase RimI-like enzyme